MAGTKTFFIIKPGAVSHEFIGPILAKINESGFHIAALKLIMLDRFHAEHFYAVHREKAFFESLVKFMTSGPVVSWNSRKGECCRRLQETNGCNRSCKG